MSSGCALIQGERCAGPLSNGSDGANDVRFNQGASAVLTAPDGRLMLGVETNEDDTPTAAPGADAD